MLTTARACAWLDRATLDPCRVDIAAYTLIVVSTMDALHLPICADHLAAAVVTSFAAYGVEALYIERAHRVPAA